MVHMPVVDDKNSSKCYRELPVTYHLHLQRFRPKYSGLTGKELAIIFDGRKSDVNPRSRFVTIFDHVV